MKESVKLAIASDFLKAFSKIPKDRQSKVLKFIDRFRSDPTSSSINYEKIKAAVDPNLKSVRIDLDYRGIVFKPNSGNVFILLWVANHDDAYDWASKRSFKINPSSGSLQIVQMDSEDQHLSSTEKEQHKVPGLFDSVKDKHLMRLGVPEDFLPIIRKITTEEELDEKKDPLPVEAYDSLLMIAAGFTYEETMHELEISDLEKEVDTTDYLTALKNPDSQSRFMLVEDDLELQKMLSAPLDQWRVFLHPSQRKLVERNWNGPVRVLGGAGTGKTVVAMHRAKWLASNHLKEENDRILFTTFSRNLAADIQENLAKICPEEIFRKIEVVNLDRWVSDYLRKQGYELKIDYGKRSQEFWSNSLTHAPSDLELPDSFYKEEWDRVIQPQGITKFDAYLKVSRVGRGVSLTRKARKAIWPVFSEYQSLLQENGLRESDDAIRDARTIMREKGDILPYRAILVDEAQDMSAQAFQLLRQMIPGDDKKNDLFIVGDGHQRIYRHKVVLGRCGINVRGRRSRKLRINYRTTEQNRKWAADLLAGKNIDDLNGGMDSQRGYKSLLKGIDPVILTLKSFEEEVAAIKKFLEKTLEEIGSLSEVCLVTRTNSLRDQYVATLEGIGIKTYTIKRSEPENRKVQGLRLATMHRVKGLEFDRMIIASVNEGIVPLSFSKVSEDQVVQEESELQERALLYVAATRAKKSILITSYGKKSHFLETPLNVSNTHIKEV